MATEQHRQAMLESSSSYAAAKLAFANFIVIAQRAGMTEEEIARRGRPPGAGHASRAPNALTATPPPVAAIGQGVGVP